MNPKPNGNRNPKANQKPQVQNAAPKKKPSKTHVPEVKSKVK